MEQPEPQHWPTERMIAEGRADYATPEDLENFADETLVAIAEICEVDQFAPEECIPCLAHTMYLDRQRALLEEAEAKLEYPYGPEPTDEQIEVFEGQVVPELLEMAERHAAPFQEEKPVVERFAEQVRSLSGLVEELLEGPPIPPPGVTQEELALLVVAAQRWIRITEAQGVALAPEQEQILAATKTLIARMNRG